MEKKKSTKKWVVLSFICFISGVAFWLPNVIIQDAYFYWMLTFVVNPVGALFGFLGKSKFGMFSNGMMTFSFFIVMFVVYVVEAMSM